MIKYLFFGILAFSISLSLGFYIRLQKEIDILKIPIQEQNSATELGGLTRVAIGTQTKWTTSLVPSASFTVNLGSATLPVNSYFGTRASLSNNLEVGNIASAAKYFGNALTSLTGTTGCSGATDTLNYNSSTGVFSCGSDATGSTASDSLNFDEFQNPLVLDTNITVTSGAFNWSWGATNFLNIGNASISKNLEIGGFASVSGNITTKGTITSTNTGSNSFSGSLLLSKGLVSQAGVFNGPFQALSTASNSFTGSLTIAKGLVVQAGTFNGKITGLASTSVKGFLASGLTDCDNSTSSKLLWSDNGSFSCGADQTLTVGSNSLNFDEFQNPLVLDTNITTTSGSFTWNFGSADLVNIGTASISRRFESHGIASISNTLFVNTGTNGYAGINTSAPSQRFSVVGNSGETTRFSVESGTTFMSYGADPTNGPFYTFNGNQRLRFGTSTDTSGSGFVERFGISTSGASTSNNFEVGGFASISNSGYFKLPTRSSLTFAQAGEMIFDNTDFQFQVATAAANSPRVIPTIQKLWSGTIASTSNEWLSGGRIYLGSVLRDKYNIDSIYCDVESGTSVVINVSNRNGTYDTETVTCSTTGTSDTSIDTNSGYGAFTTVSSSLEIGTITGSPNWLNFTIYGIYLPK